MTSPNTVPVDLLKSSNVTELAVASNAVAYSHSFLIENCAYGLELQGDVSAGSIDIKVELEVGGTLPDTEGSADTDFTIPQALGGGTNQDCIIDASLNTELVRFYPFPPVVAPYGRFKFTGGASNDASGKIVRALLHKIS